ncbi:uncharacterized protein LOC123270705 [Cotesia glomerata]|uniref:uncharacterized protein LOC123270705 n=1 Tax=Cotesia glomerata TaxID=32391 RepID=UPI001D02B422|nr:uncharacterized protein LOC123270705 [Cotesia glomerata]
MSLHKNFCFKYFIIIIIIIIIVINQAYAIDYTLYRNDSVPSLESVASKIPPLENLLHALIAAPSTSSLQQKTEKLLEYAGLVRLKLLSKLGFEVYNNDELNLPEVTALNDIYQRTLKRKDNLLLILPFKNITVQQFCSLVDESSSGKTCNKIIQEIPLTFPPAPTPAPASASVNLSLNSILTDLKSHKLELTSQLFLGLLLHVPFNNYDARTHNSMRHLIFSLLQDSDLKFKTSVEHRNYHRITDLVHDILTSGVFFKATPHAQYLSEQLEEIIPLNSNIEALSAILEDNKINLKFLLDTVLPNDTLDGDLIDAKNYLYHKLRNIKDWDINELVGAEKYEYLKQDQLLIGLLDKLIDLDFIKDIASALKVNAYFWHKSHMIENLNDLLDLFDNYNNLRGVTTYRELIKTISRIKDNLINSKNITIELLCTRPRACLKQGLIKVRQCRGINPETKSLIDNFFEQTKDCSECITEKCNQDNTVVPAELDSEPNLEPDCEDSEECESDEVKASMVEDDENLKRLKKVRVEVEESEGSTTESWITTEGSVEETTEHIEVVKVITEASTTEANEFSTTEATTEFTTTELTDELTTEAPKTTKTTERSTTELLTTVKITEPTTTVIITEPTDEKFTEKVETTTEKKIEWVQVPLKEVTLKPSISVNMQKESEAVTLGTTESTVRDSVKMIPTPNVKVKIETPIPTILVPTTVAPQPKRKRVICHHRDLYHRKKLKKLNKLNQKQGSLLHSGSSHVSFGDLKLNKLNLQSDSENIEKLTTLRPIFDSGDQKIVLDDKNLNLGDKVDLHVQAHSGELGLYSDSASGKVDLLSHSDLEKLQLHSNSKFNSSQGVNSDSGSDKNSLQSKAEVGENVSGSTDDDHSSSILEKTYKLASKGAEKIKSGIEGLNPFGRKSKDSSQQDENKNININARRSRLGSKIFDSSEEMPRNSDKSDSSGSDQDSTELEDNYFENRKKKKKSKEFSKIKNSESSHNHKKMTSYYNEEVKEEKVKKRRSNSVRRSQSRKSSKSSRSSRRADHQNHKGHYHSRRKNVEENSADGVKSRMLDLDLTKFMNFEVKRDENVRKKVPTAKRSVDNQQRQIKKRLQGKRLARVLRETPHPHPHPPSLLTSETEVKPRILNIGVASKFANIEFKRDENYTEFKK